MKWDKGMNFSPKMPTLTVPTKQKTAWKNLKALINYDCGG